MEYYSLLEVNKHLQQVIALNFKTPLWVKGEIAGLGTSGGHYYLNLAEKSTTDGQVIAKASATIWKNVIDKWKKLPSLRLVEILKEGNEILIQVTVSFHPIYGLKFNILDIDPTFTLGGLALERQKTINTLQAENLLEKNKSLFLPRVLQRIAIVSSDTADGYQDFIRHLNENAFGYAFFTRLFNSRVQGVFAAEEMTRQLQKIAHLSDQFDCVVLIRGGGSNLDLLAFDDLNLARTVAQCPLPVLTGIGHDADECVIDRVAYTPIKTPTAVADFIILRNQSFEQELEALFEKIRQIGKKHIDKANPFITLLKQQLQQASQRILNYKNNQLSLFQERLQSTPPHILQKRWQHLDKAEAQLQLLDPQAILQRGYTLTTIDGKPLSTDSLNRVGATIETYAHFGIFTSTLINGKKHE